MNRLAIITATAGVLALAAPLSAQRANEKRTEIPTEQRPPAGMCRIWLDGVPASQQPAPTDCATAIRHRPPNGRVIFGNLRDTVVQKRQVRPFIDRTRSTDRRIDSNTNRSRDRDPRLDSVGNPARAQRDDEPPTGSRATPPVRTPPDQRTNPTTNPRTERRAPTNPRAERRPPKPRTRVEPDKRQRPPVRARRDTSAAFPGLRHFR
jgi:hypothetical protein